MNNYLEINLSDGSWSEKKISSGDREQFLGGKGLALKLIYDRMAPGTEPLDPENIIAFMSGVLLGSGAPCTGRWSVVTKSPLTNIFTHSSCGGPFGIALYKAGYEGLLITGKADRPVYIEIETGEVRIEPADRLKGLRTTETQDALGLEKGQGACVIGPAGENGVLYANLRSGHRYAGRGGIGAVFGSKNLKAVVARGGEYSFTPVLQKRFGRHKKKALAMINRNSFASEAFRTYGTSVNIIPCNKAGLLPVRNFTLRTSPEAEHVSGETMAEKYDSKPSTCKPCSILCGHKGTHPDGTVHQIPEYETVGLFGPNLQIYDTGFITACNDICGELGMDTISAGSVIGWAMEAEEQGLFRSGLRFNRPDGILDHLEDIAYMRKEGAELALGTMRLSEKYGGCDFAAQVKGLELAAYDPRGAWGQALGYAVANRGGCHLSSYMVGMEAVFPYLEPYSLRSKAEWVVFFENLFAAVNSLHTCAFLTFPYLLEPAIPKYLPETVLKLSMRFFPNLSQKLMNWSMFSNLFTDISGVRISQGKFLRAGERIHILERFMNNREGIRSGDDTLPERFLREDSSDYPRKDPIPLNKLLNRYYSLRRYKDNGVPEIRLLRKLGIGNTGGRGFSDEPASRAALPRKPVKKIYTSLLMWFLSRAVRAASSIDEELMEECKGLPDNFSFRLRVHPYGPEMALSLDGQNRFRVLRPGSFPVRFNVDIRFKHIEAAMLLFTFREGTTEAFARDRMTVKGNLPEALAVVRLLNIVEVYLLPRFLARKAVKEYPRWSFGRKHGGRLRIYLKTLLGL